MAAKVPKFGAWEGEENYTVYFDNARKTKSNGPMINPNDPEENPNMFPHNGAPAQAPPTHRGAESQGQQSKVPQFGAWDNEDNAGYSAYFENARKTRNSGPSKTEEPHLNRDMNPRDEPPAHTHSATVKPEPQEAQSKLPQFGAWEVEGQVAYTAVFDTIMKTKSGPIETDKTSDVPQLNRDVTPRNKPTAQESRSKVPQFGAWDGGETVQYTAYFDNARKNRDEPVEPQLNRDVGERARPPSAATKVRSEEYIDRSKSDQRNSKEEGQLRNASRGSTGSDRQGRQTPGGQSPLHSKGGKSQSKPGGRGSQTPERGTTIPPFGVWNNDPTKAEGYTGTFMRAREDRMTPLGKNTPTPYNNQSTQYTNQEPKKGCCWCPWF